MASQYEKRKVKDAVIETPALPVEEPVTYNATSYDVYFDESIKKFIRVEVEYNRLTGAARLKESKPIADSLPVATRKMGELFNRILLKIQHD